MILRVFVVRKDPSTMLGMTIIAVVISALPFLSSRTRSGGI
jgi:hypothetical protein